MCSFSYVRSTRRRGAIDAAVGVNTGRDQCIAEQLSIDQPRGIKAAYFALRQKREVHDAEHAIMECLGKTIWRSQRDKAPMDGEAYLECVLRK